MTAEPGRAKGFDPVLLAVLSNRLEGVAREMTNTLLRSARSAIIAIARDFSCSLITPQADLLVCAESLPIHAIGSELLAAAMHERHGNDLRPGDAFLHNDPYSGNSHAADHCILVPIFVNGVHVLTACAKAHQADCGDSIPTTYMPSARDVYEEGALIFPCVRVERDYSHVDDIIEMCRRRIRVPEQWYGDFLAMLGATRVAERRVAELVSEHGIETLQAFVTEWLDYSERRMQQAIRRMPSMTLVGRSVHDPYPGLEDGLELAVTVQVDAQDGRIVVDARDNPDNYAGGLNLTKSTAMACAVAGVLNSLPEDVPANSGSMRRIEILLREGCVVGIPRFPHSCSVATTNLADRFISAMQTAFAGASNDLGLAEGSFGTPPQKGVVSGRDARAGGRPFINQMILGKGGGPGGPMADGWPTYGRAVTAGLMYHDSIEVDEQKYPILVHECSLARDTGGAGRHRGGVGCRVLFAPTSEPVTVVYFLDGYLHPPTGVRGGAPGSTSEAWLVEADGQQAQIPAYGTIELAPGEIIGSLSSGGGGYGDPLERDPERVLEDVLEGWVSEAAAREAYGVSLARVDTPDGLAVDRPGTEALRDAIRRGRVPDPVRSER